MATTVTLKPNAIDISGSTSGTTTLQATAVAGTTTVTLPATTGTVITTGDTGTVTNTMLAGSIANAKLTNSSVTIGGTAIALGASSSTITNDLSISGLTVGKGGGSVSTNTAVGASALAGNSTNGKNTAVGYQALQNNNAISNTAVGYLALATKTSTGDYCTAVGDRALYLNTSGGSNTAVGGLAGYSNTTGTANTALGEESLFSNTTASNNTAVGYQAGYSNTTSVNNVFLGYQAGYNNTGAGNTFLGYLAGYSVTSGTNNTIIGGGAGYLLTTGTQNTFVGPNNSNAGYFVTTGSKNTILGGYSGNQGGLDIRTASNYIVLSDGDGNPRQVIDTNGKVCIGAVAVVNGSIFEVTYNAANQVAYFCNTLGSGTPYGIQIRYRDLAPNNTTGEFIYCNDSSVVRFMVKSNGGIYNYSANNSNLSDAREKKNIELAPNYLDKICQIPVKTFLLNDQTDEDLNLGVIAQDVQAVCPELVHESNWAGKDEPEKLRLSIYQTDLQYALMKSIQELKALVDAQATEIAELKAKVA